MTRLLLGLFLLVAPPAVFGQPPSATSEAHPAEQVEPAEEAVSSPTDLLVVTASRREEQLVNAPATMTVLTGEELENTAGHNIADLFRAVPGLNTVQTSARDVNVNTRAATGTLSDSQLALLDGRSMYQDFFGFVLWDLLPLSANEIKQIEIIRGPASAVWGANAMNGVVNVITKTPRECERNLVGN